MNIYFLFKSSSYGHSLKMVASSKHYSKGGSLFCVKIVSISTLPTRNLCDWFIVLKPLDLTLFSDSLVNDSNLLFFIFDFPFSDSKGQSRP